jgi:site-specific recombinase XerD
MHLPTFTIVFNYRNTVNKNGLYPIHIRVTLNRISKFYRIKAPLNVAKKHWSGNYRQWVRDNHPYSLEINDRIFEKLQTLEDLLKRFYLNKQQILFSDIFKALQAKSVSESYNSYFEEIIKDSPEYLLPATFKRYHAALLALNKFNSNVTFYELNEEFFQRLKKFCKEKLNLSASTIRGYFYAYKKTLHWARLDAHITREEEKELLEEVRHRPGRPKKDFLEIQEIIDWRDYKFPERYLHFERDRDMFLLSIYTGLYYNDLKKLPKTALRVDPEKGYYLLTQRYKNDTHCIIPLWTFPHSIELLDRYKEKEDKEISLLRKDAFIEVQAFNRNLKNIVGPNMLNWKRNIYNKLARNTFAQLYIRQGVPRAMLSRMMGHEKEETTSLYYDVNIKEVIEGVKDIDFAKVGL